MGVDDFIRTSQWEPRSIFHLPCVSYIHAGFPADRLFCLQPLACWFLLKLFLRPWRWRRYVPPKRRLQLNRRHGITSQKMILFITTAVNTSNPTTGNCPTVTNIWSWASNGAQQQDGLTDIMLPSMPRFSKLSLYSRVSNPNFKGISNPSHACYIPHLLHLITQIISYEAYNLCSSILCSVHQLPVTTSLLVPLSLVPCSVFFPQYKSHVSDAYETKHWITVFLSAFEPFGRFIWNVVWTLCYWKPRRHVFSL
jgi:hypothetical protein